MLPKYTYIIPFAALSVGAIHGIGRDWYGCCWRRSDSSTKATGASGVEFPTRGTEKGIAINNNVPAGVIESYVLTSSRPRNR